MMEVDREIQRVLRLYPEDCQPQTIEPIFAPESFSGAEIWRISAPRGNLCMRCWSSEHPKPDRLQFIQAVLWHVDQEGFSRIPLPLETRHKHGFIRHAGRLWELAPWLPGAADYRQRPSVSRLRNAMIALAHFHVAARTFPLPEIGPSGSPGMADRVLRLQGLLGGRIEQLRQAIVSDDRSREWPELRQLGERLIELATRVAPKLLPQLEHASTLDVTLVPCIRDVWHAHILFVDDLVSGIVDFGAMRPDNVATDIARLLGSLALDNWADWQRGLAAYQIVRRLSDEELSLVTAFDRSAVLMGGIQWLEWIYLERREFSGKMAVLVRIEEFLTRLEKLAQTIL